ncbi:hypothetical protein LOH54_03110 [Sulfurimonas sp. HSL-3221]|uniref:hypothetical protein n=1 Tax=Thiomicrolovo sulfuroxydans TaxID=2894755 RepID=UPI001E282BC9|nr:hypothetical protein [Sulfurimonas sp. HSL-3221]UFS63121.1 hypothetical protein LOH54_03110 [Sulfurimonas sp. HSL-3221]
MSKKVSLTVNRSRFDIDLDDAFADFLLEQLDKDFKLDANNDLKVLLQAYVRKNYELFEQAGRLEEMLNTIDAKN